MSQVSERYAQAFVSLAQEENKVSALREEAERALNVFDNNVKSFLGNSGITKQEKKDVLMEAFKNADTSFRNLLNVLVDSSRAFYTKEVLEDFIKLANQELNIQEVLVYSAKPLSEEDSEKIKKAVADKLGKEVIIKNRIDHTLLAGTRIYVNNRVYDSSLKAKVSHLKEELLKESW